MKILLCMASGQTAANIHSLNEIKPDLVIVAVTTKMQQSGTALLEEIKSSGIKAEPLILNNETSLKALNEQLEQWVSAHLDHDIVVNITGGTKLMSIAAFGLFSQLGIRCFYQNVDPSHLIWLDDESIIPKIGQTISLERYLRIHQFKMGRHTPLAQVPSVHKMFAQTVYADLCKAGNFEKVA